MSESENVVRIGACDWPDLTRLWVAIESGSAADWAPGKAFEYLVLRAFQLEGAEIEWPYSVSLADVTRGGVESAAEQIDGFVMVDGLACLLECKDRKDPLNIESIAKMRNLIRNEDKISYPIQQIRNKNYQRFFECNSLRCNSASPVIRFALFGRQGTTESTTE